MRQPTMIQVSNSIAFRPTQDNRITPPALFGGTLTSRIGVWSQDIN
jgi:hypothetical protein